MNPPIATLFELHYRSLYDSGRGYAFPCDARGQVNPSTLSEHARTNYFLARAMVGTELDYPAVEPVSPS